MKRVALFVTAFGRPDLLREQHRLLHKNLLDPFTLRVLDNTPDPYRSSDIEVCASELGIPYTRVVSEKHEHPDALTVAARIADESLADYWGCIDHDLVPSSSTTLIDRLERVGFLGVGQTYAPRVGAPLLYLWPGWCFFTRRWLNDRVPNFYGIRGEHAFDDGDAGSLLHTLFTDADWERLKLAKVEHGYGAIRENDGHGLQSYGFEDIDGSWRHFTNGSRWKAVPRSEERDRLILEMLRSL